MNKFINAVRILLKYKSYVRLNRIQASAKDREELAEFLFSNLIKGQTIEQQIKTYYQFKSLFDRHLTKVDKKAKDDVKTLSSYWKHR